MRSLIFISVLFFTTSLFAQKTSAGVNIPGSQTFLLGEYADYPYSAKLKNRGTTRITVKLASKEDGSIDTSLVLSPRESAALDVSAAQQVMLINDSKRKARIDVKMSTNVVGMRYLKQGEQTLDLKGRVAEEPAAPAERMAEPTMKTYSVKADASLAVEAFEQSLKSGKKLIIGEGTSESYSIDLRKFGSSIKVSVRNRETNEVTQSFGMGGNGNPVTLYVRPYEVVYLINKGAVKSKVVAEFSKPVSGLRIQ